MRRSWRSWVYYLLIPSVLIAAAIVAYYTLQTASRFDRLGSQTILESTLLLVDEKVEGIEQTIIAADNDVFALVDPSDPARIEATWPPLARELSPSVRALLVIAPSGAVAGYALRGNERSKREFLELFRHRMLPELEAGNPSSKLKHLHRDYGTGNYLLSYKTVRHRGSRWMLVAHHDTGYIRREIFTTLFTTEEIASRYNVVDDHNQNERVFGPSLAGAGDFLVGRRFPTTLYNWRLQVAPKTAPLLDENRRSSRYTQVALLGTAFAVMLLGLIFLLYAANTERKLNALKSVFIANVTHELKTPLAAIKMFTEMLLTGRVPSKERERDYLKLISTESERLHQLIENVLDFAALERGKQTYERIPGDVAVAVEQAVTAVRSRVGNRGHVISLEIMDGLPEVSHDQQAVKLALINLIDNALKYGEGVVDVCVEKSDYGRVVELQVRDRGPGIAEQDLERIFERFYRGQSEAQVRGSGIGLAIVRHVAEGHDGRVWARNAEDGGAIITLSLPATEQAIHANPNAGVDSPTRG